jgi:hypothetical protein
MITSEELQKIVELANGVPEVYREKCFELLLSHVLYGKQPSMPLPSPIPSALPQSPASAGKPFVLPIDVKAFLSQYGLDESVLWKFFIVDGQEIRPIYQLQVTKKATAQIQHALLMALENALSSGQFQVDIDSLRTRCNDQKCYDGANFMKNIKDKANLFKSIANDEPLSLSLEGKSELADVIEELKG